MTDLPYRPCAGVMLMNRDGRVFVGQRLDSTLEAWQMPQGGIDPGEDGYAAAVRELFEETGVVADHVELIAEAPGEFFYDLPDELIGKVWKGKWRGQRQRWFLFRFLGNDGDIDIRTAHPEFRTWRWAARSCKDAPTSRTRAVTSSGCFWGRGGRAKCIRSVRTWCTRWAWPTMACKDFWRPGSVSWCSRYWACPEITARGLLISCPAPATSGLGSASGDTTRAMPEATTASAQGGLRP